MLGINEPPVTIKADREDHHRARLPRGLDPPGAAGGRARGKRVAIVGSGPAGLAAAQQLNRAGHWVTVFEKADRLGGLLRYGIPDFKLEKRYIDRRLGQLVEEGVRFETRAHVGHNVPVEDLREEFDAILLAGGAEQPRDLRRARPRAEGHPFRHGLPAAAEQAAAPATGTSRPIRRAAREEILATGKRVVIIGGGDTGADCLGTCHRQKARSVCQFEIMPKPPDQRSELTPWPLWPLQLRIESSHEEGGVRDWSVATTRFTGDENGNVKQLHAVRVGPPPKFEPVPGSEFTMDADLVLLAMGFTGPVRGGMIEQLGVELDERGNVKTGEDYMTSVPGVFAAGDMRRGQSLVVWAIAEGRQAARAIDLHLMGTTRLP